MAWVFRGKCLNRMNILTKIQIQTYVACGMSDMGMLPYRQLRACQFDNILCLLWQWGSHIFYLTHWGRVTHICVSRLTITGSDNGLSPGQRQAIIWTNAGILLIGPLGTNFSENVIEILAFSFKNMRLKVSSAKWRPFCLGLSVLRAKDNIFSVLSLKMVAERVGRLYQEALSLQN